MLRRTLAACFGIVMLVGCGTDVSDEGAVCLNYPDPNEDPSMSMSVNVEADQVLRVKVVYDGCASCVSDFEGACTVTREGSRLVVRSSFSYDDSHPPGTVCTTACTEIGAACQVGPLEAGSYTIVHGDKESSFTVPSTIQNSCVL